MQSAYRARIAIRCWLNWPRRMLRGWNITAGRRRCNGLTFTISCIYLDMTMHHADLNESSSTTSRTVCFDQGRLTIEDIVDIASASAQVTLSADPAFRAAITRGADFLD